MRVRVRVRVWVRVRVGVSAQGDPSLPTLVSATAALHLGLLRLLRLLRLLHLRHQRLLHLCGLRVLHQGRGLLSGAATRAADRAEPVLGLLMHHPEHARPAHLLPSEAALFQLRPRRLAVEVGADAHELGAPVAIHLV